MKKREIDRKKEGDQKIEGRIENAAKEISHKLTTRVQTEAVRVMTDTEITKEIRKKVIRIKIEIQVPIIAAVAEIEKEIDSYKNRRYDYKSNRDKEWNERDIIRGVNCSNDYKPKYEFRCLKCMTEDDHHEFYCKKFHRRSKIVCKNCKVGFHLYEECNKDRSRSRERKNW